MDKFIMWSFPLIVMMVFLMNTVSKLDMPHFSLPEPPHRQTAQNDQPDFDIDYSQFIN